MVLLAVAGLLAAPGAARADDPYTRYLEVIASDPSYKVRMKAIRVLAKVAKGRPPPLAAAVLDGLGRAATADDSYMVRGMACVALGQLAAPEARPALEQAGRDPEAIVRALAEAALALLSPPVDRAQGDLLVVGTAPDPAVEVAPELQDSLLSTLEAELGARARGFRVARGGDGSGYHLTGTVSRLDAVPEGEDDVRLTMEVKLAVATWPQDNLRHVLSAKASAKVKRTASRARVHEQLLRAAVGRAVQDALTQIGGS